MSKKRYQTGGVLPSFDFANIRQAVVPRPIQEFGTLVGTLNNDFDTGLQSSNDLLAQAVSLQTSPFEEDRRRGELLKNEALSNIEEIRGQGNFENQVTNIRKLAGDFNRSSIPLLQRKQSFDGFVNNLNQLNIGADTKAAIIDEVKRRENLNPTLVTTEDGITLNSFRPEAFQSLLAEDVDIATKLDKLGRGIESDISPFKLKLVKTKP